MKIDFLPLMQMVYSDLYGNCEDIVLDPHIDPNCGALYLGELARIRKGAWVHKDYYATLIANPITAATWTTGITAGSIILLKELNGSFDGGTPKTVPGFGDVKEYTTGYDFTATLKDRVYIENYAHYLTVSQSANYHLAYCTQTQVHITGVPVSASPKNTITENVDDYVIWETTVKWFQQFTPAPHAMPAGIF